MNPEDELTYDDLILPKYKNSNTAARIRVEVDGEFKTIDLTICDIVFAAEIAGLNMLFVSDTGLGKTQLMTDIAWHHFGGDQKGGNANIAMGRADFEIEDLLVRTKVDLDSGSYDSREARQIDPDRAGRIFFGVDEMNRAPPPRQTDLMDLANGERNFNGSNEKLGKEGYSVFIAAANLNKKNGDHNGIYDFDRAMLNRAHLTIDFDHKPFKPTPDDQMDIQEASANPKVGVSEPRDISDKLIKEFLKIQKKNEKSDPYLMGFSFLIGDGLDHCELDQSKEKGPGYPMHCIDCEGGKRMSDSGTEDQTSDDQTNDSIDTSICSRIKSSSVRTRIAVQALTYGISRIVELKTKGEVAIDPLDAAQLAFKFTTYHGNLNENIADEEYDGRKQMMMDDTIEKLSKAVGILDKYIDTIQETGHSSMVVYDFKNQTTGQIEERTGPRTQSLVDQLSRLNITPKEQGDMKEDLKKIGIGTDWVDAYVKRVHERYQNEST